MKSFLKDIEKNFKGDVWIDESHLNSYQTDESIFKVQPKVVVCPKNEEDVEIAVQLAQAHQMPITARGGGTGVAGQSIGDGMILDFSKHMNRILDISKHEAIVEPGVVLENLNLEASKLKTKFAPDPGSWDRCTLGGMIANNAAGPHALIHGSTRDHIRSLKVVLRDGKYSSDQLPEKFSALVNSIQNQSEVIQKSRIRVDKNSSGYFLEGLLESPPSFVKLLTGSEGTLGMITQATLRLAGIPTEIHFGVFAYDSILKAAQAVEQMKEAAPACLELIGDQVVQMLCKTNPALMEKLGLSKAGAALWIEWNGKPSSVLREEAVFLTDNYNEIKNIWAERSQVSKILHKQAEKENRKPLRCIEDACVPLKNLVHYIEELQMLLNRHDAAGAIFGHVGNGHLHVNPNIRTDLPDLSGRVQKLMDEFYELVFKMEGTISGEHGDGFLRVKYAQKQWKNLWPLFMEIKNAFDPNGIFNPGKKISNSIDFPALKY